MSDHPDDTAFNLNEDAGDKFDSLPDGSPASVPPDEFDQLNRDEEAGGVFAPQKTSPRVPDFVPDEGGPYPPEKRDVTEQVGRPWLKIVAGVVVIGLVGTGGVVFGPGLINGRSTPPVSIPNPKPNDQPIAVTPQLGTTPDEKPVKTEGAGGESSPVRPPVVASSSALRPVDELTKDLESSDATTKQKARKEIVEASVGTNSEDVEVLKKLKAATSQLLKDKANASTPDESLEDDVTDLILRLRLKSRGVTDEPGQPSDKTGAQLAPTPVNVAETAVRSPSVAPLPWPYSFLLAAVLGADPAADNEQTRKINAALEELKKLPEEQRCGYHLLLADLYMKSSNVERALHHLELAELDAKKFSLPSYLVLIDVKRREVVDDALKAFSKDASARMDKLENAVANPSTKDAVLDAVKSLLKTGALQSVVQPGASRPKGIEEAVWNNDVNRVKELAQLQEDGFAELAASDVLADYYRLSRLHVALVEADAGDAAAKIAGLTTGLDEITKEDGRLAKLDASVKERAAVDNAVRQAIRSLLEPGTLADRLGKCKPSDAETRTALAAAKDVASKRDEKYLNGLANLKGEALWADYEQLRQIEMKLVAWESRQALDLERMQVALETRKALDALLDTPEAKQKIAKLVLAGIQSEKDNADGLLADIQKLAKVKQIPEDLVGRAEVEKFFEEKIIPNPTNPGSGGVSAAAMEARVKKAESTAATGLGALGKQLDLEESERKASDKKLSASADALGKSLDESESRQREFGSHLQTAAQAITAVRGDLKSAREELEKKIEQPRPLSPDQLAELKGGLAGTVTTTVAEELARRGVLPPELPKCEIPKGRTSDANRKKAIYQFNEGCTYFYLNSKDQLPAATRCFSQATTLDPNEPVYRYFLGCSLYGEGQPVEAMNQVRCAAELEKQRQVESEVSRRLERIQFGTRQWLERSRQSVLLGL